MAKVTGPLMSLDASGTVANTATFSKWKGRNYVRLRVIPQNPRSPDQIVNRISTATISKAGSAVLTARQDVALVGSQFYQDAVAQAPSGQSWISWMQKTEKSQFAGIETDYGALGGTIQGYFDTNATTAALFDYTPPFVGATVRTAGEQLYIDARFAVQYLSYTGFASGVDSASNAEVAAFVTYLHVTT